MWRRALWGLLLSCGASAFAASGDGGLADPNITYVGRWDQSSSTRYTSHWDGAYLTARFTGRNVAVKLAEGTGFRAVIDGGPAVKVWGWTGSAVPLTSTALANDGPHTLQIIADYDTTEVQFQGLVLDPGATTLPIIGPRPLIEFIGDSITAGQGSSEWATTDHAWLTGEALGAFHTQIARAGITLTDGFHYSDNTWPGMESMYFRAWVPDRCGNPQCTPDPTHPAVPPWDFSKYSPKVIVVNLGTNDWNLGVPKSQFQTEYTSFLANVRAKHPAAEIFVLRTFNGYLVPETQAAVNARISAGDTRLHFVNTDGWLTLHPSADFSDGFHPSDAGYKKVRDRLVPILLPYVADSVVSVNDARFNYDSTASWPSGGQVGAYQNDNHWSNMPGASYQVPFSGTQVHLYGARAPWHGIAAVSIDGGPETNVDTYAASRADGVWLWSSPVLAAGPHTLKVRVTGQKNASASGTYVVADRVDIVNGGLNVLGNAGFESGPSDWTVATSAPSQSYVSTTSPRSGTSHLVHSSASPYWVATFQTPTGLSNGLYTARAWVWGTAGHQLYVKNYGGAQKSITLTTGSNTYTELVIRDINVTNGSAEVGLWSYDPAGNGWLIVDDVSFYKQ
ncbi:GDSL-type esterase/lipase family protein [Ideonella sp.]|uniref:GDSL-type esterase/lipase family protein n=1 Tax=Ideonella sp. TaxID=1929293 RepID=UPI002B45BBE5|nr:GDSL-type esterase/lipase family protein [Ideonella sp.]HJV69226.1 GDSL-type esterase/lipase family protein [Ideonella sp.]